MIFALLFSALSISAETEAEELSVGFSDQTYDIGHGFNPVTGSFYRPCIEPPNIVSEAAGSKTDSYQIKRIMTSTEIRESLNLNAYASTFGGAYKVNASVGKLITSGLKSNSTYFSVRVRVAGVGQTIANDISISENGLKALQTSGEFFKQYCGDSFVASTRGGGELFALITMQNISEEQANNFLASLDAAYLSSDAQVNYRQQWSKHRVDNQLVAEIMQAGLIGESFKSLTDIEELLEYARQFPEKLRKFGGANTQAVIYQKYTQSVAFGNALQVATKDRFQDFDQSSLIMRNLVRAFDLSNSRVELASDALSSPDDFEKFDVAQVKSLLGELMLSRDRLADKAQACAEASKDGNPCSRVAAEDLIVPDTASLKRSIPCNVTTFGVSNGSAASSCSQVRKISGQCLCVECQLFLDPPYALHTGQKMSDRCTKMPKTAQLSLAVKFNVNVSPSARDHHVVMGINDTTNLSKEPNIAGNRTTILKVVDAKVDQDGDFSASLNMWQCQSNVATQDTCTLGTLEGKPGPLITVRARD